MVSLSAILGLRLDRRTACWIDLIKITLLYLNHFSKAMVMFSIPFLFPTISLAFADKTGPQVTDIDRIRDTLECRLFTFSPYVQRHYALRMYRITGDDKYLNPIITDMMVLAQLLRQDIEGLGDEDYIRARTQLILERFDLNKPKQQRRYELLNRSGHLAFDLALLANLNMLHEVNLLDTAFFLDTSKTLAYLKERDFADFFLADDVVRIYSPQLATYVFFLYDLGIADLRKPFIAAFRRVFPDHRDAELSSMLYTQKLYGLTHIIIGASRNYQKIVDKDAYDWIYEYFSKNVDTITARATEDIIAEVGIAFLLSESREAPALKKIQHRIASAVDDELGIILSPTGSADLESGEHRNVLAVMLFSWPDQLHSGPDLRNSPVYQRFWLRNYLP